MKKIHTGDNVIVTAGKWKWTTSTVLAIAGKKDQRRWLRVTVKGVNVVKKSKKGEWFQELEAPIHRSNIMHWDEKSKKASKVWIRKDKNWRNERYYKLSGNKI